VLWARNSVSTPEPAGGAAVLNRVGRCSHDGLGLGQPQTSATVLDQEGAARAYRHKGDEHAGGDDIPPVVERRFGGVGGVQTFYPFIRGQDGYMKAL
jgi:hypothetical protein